MNVRIMFDVSVLNSAMFLALQDLSMRIKQREAFWRDTCHPDKAHECQRSTTLVLPFMDALMRTRRSP